MITHMEKVPTNEASNKLDNVEVRKCLNDRRIKPEDMPLVERLSSFPTDLLIMGLHNMFNVHKEQSGQVLERLIQTSPDITNTSLLQTALELYNRYGWAASLQLERALEEA